MKCPVDQVDLIMTERQGVEIDYCPQCRGVWLDRGELDKIIDRSAELSARETGDFRDERRRTDNDERRRPDYDDDDYRRRRKRKSFIGELFDFD